MVPQYLEVSSTCTSDFTVEVCKGMNNYVTDSTRIEPPQHKHWTTMKQTLNIEPQLNKILTTNEQNCYLIICLTLNNHWTNVETQLKKIRTRCTDEQNVYLNFTLLNHHWTNIKMNKIWTIINYTTLKNIERALDNLLTSINKQQLVKLKENLKQPWVLILIKIKCYILTLNSAKRSH